MSGWIDASICRRLDDQKIREWINELMNERMNDSVSLENWLLLYSQPFLPILLFLLPYLVASCRLWKVRLGKLANRKVSSSPKA